MKWTDELIDAIAADVAGSSNSVDAATMMMTAYMREMRDYFLDTKTLAADANQSMARVKVLEAQVKELTERKYN